MLCFDKMLFYLIFRETNDTGLENFDEVDVTKHMSLVNIGALYLMMGRELENLHEVPAGNIVGNVFHIRYSVHYND